MKIKCNILTGKPPINKDLLLSGRWDSESKLPSIGGCHGQRFSRFFLPYYQLCRKQSNCLLKAQEIPPISKRHDIMQATFKYPVAAIGVSLKTLYFGGNVKIAAHAMPLYGGG